MGKIGYTKMTYLLLYTVVNNYPKHNRMKGKQEQENSYLFIIIHILENIK